MTDDDTLNRPSWRQPTQQEGVKQYLQTIRERWWVVLLTMLLTTAAAAAYVLTAEKVYEAEADVLVSPVPDDAQILTSLGLPARSSDPLRDVETAARLISSVEVAQLAAPKLSDTSAKNLTPEELRDALTAAPLADSNIVSLIAQSDDPETAAAIANAFGEAAINERTRSFQERLKSKLAELETSVEDGDPADPQVQATSQEIAQLKLLEDQPDPTLTLEVPARAPDGPISPRPLLSLIAGALAGLILGIGAVFLHRVVDPRLRREEQLFESFRLPVLARIPQDPNGGGTSVHMPISPNRLSPQTIEAYRTLRGTLGIFRPPGGGARSVFVTSASAKEGKSTTALGLAAAMAQAGNRVIMIEADLRRPELGSALQVGVKQGVVSVLIGETKLEDALVESPLMGPNLRLLLADHTGPATTELFGLKVAEQLIADAEAIADFVIVDSAPLVEVVDSLPLARLVDDVVICVRLKETRLDRLAQLAELLSESDIRPSGFAIVGTAARRGGYYYEPAETEGRKRGGAIRAKLSRRELDPGRA